MSLLNTSDIICIIFFKIELSSMIILFEGNFIIELSMKLLKKFFR